MKILHYKRNWLKIPVLKTSDVLVVVPAYNEAASISQVIDGVRSHGFQVLVIDDGSSDETPLVARQRNALVLSLPFNVGVGGALRCGFRYAVENGFTAVIQCDADGQHLPSHLDDLVEATNRTDAHMMIGSRFGSEKTTHDPSLLRRFAMLVLSKVAQHATKHSITDSTSGFRLIRQPLLGNLLHTFPRITSVTHSRRWWPPEERDITLKKLVLQWPRESTVLPRQETFVLSCLSARF